MNDQELAEKVVAHGVGSQPYPDNPNIFIWHNDELSCSDDEMAAEFFVRDWRVAGALIEKCKTVSWSKTTTGGSYIHVRASNNGYSESPRGEIARAFIEACCEALSD